MLAHSKEGKLCLEDHEGSVQLDFSQLVGSAPSANQVGANRVIQDQPSEGLFTEGAFALVEGDYTDEATFVVIAIGHPPCENRETTRYDHVIIRSANHAHYIQIHIWSYRLPWEGGNNTARRRTQFFISCTLVGLRLYFSRLGMLFGSNKSFPTSTSLSSRTCGWITPPHWRGSEKCLTTA